MYSVDPEYHIMWFSLTSLTIIAHQDNQNPC